MLVTFVSLMITFTIVLWMLNYNFNLFNQKRQSDTIPRDVVNRCKKIANVFFKKIYDISDDEAIGDNNYIDDHLINKYKSSCVEKNNNKFKGIVYNELDKSSLTSNKVNMIFKCNCYSEYIVDQDNVEVIKDTIKFSLDNNTNSLSMLWIDVE